MPEELRRPKTAGELMNTPGVVLGANSTVSMIAEVMVDENIGSVIVVDDNGDYLGIVCEKDFLPSQSIYPFLRGTVSSVMGFVIGTENKIEYDEAIDKIKATLCSTVMDTSVPTVSVNTPIDDVARLMESAQGHHIPVLDGRKPVGMVAQHDMLRLFIERGIAGRGA